MPHSISLGSPSHRTPSRINAPVIKGTRRTAREKVMQLLAAQEVSDVHWRENFPYVFYHEYRVDDAEQPNRLLTEEEREYLEADAVIEWDEDTKHFALDLLEKTELHTHEALALIEKFSQNWELGRLAHIDRIVLTVAITELIAFPEIPTKVSINEAIEIVKKYSTEKSGMFVNGILDSALEELRHQGKINKTGRGLLDTPLPKSRNSDSH
ncbi:MAG: transcription antitermination factor NusB [Bacteroidota bacterium]|nr:transcription antitermination factor NusB [Candidatus Kapabacteria bacterium]MDW8219699.1 transcription antitermination factor NusB [Bacteroidota bacterium]